MLQKTVSEPSRGSTNIKADIPCDSDIPMLEGALQLQSPAADIPEVIRKQSNHALRRNLSARFLKFLIVHQNFSRKNERLRALARSGQPSIHKKLVDSDFHEIFRLGARRESCSTKVAAPASVQSAEASLTE